MTGPETGPETGTIVVGLSARTSSPRALAWAAREAESRDAGLLVVRAWRPAAAQAGSRGTPSAVTSDRRAALAEAQRRLEHDVDAVLGEGHPATVRVAFGGKRRTLLAASREADLLVIEAPRRLDRGSGPGVVSRLVARSACPVVVVPRAPGDSPAGRARRTAARVGKGVAESAARAPRPGIGHPRP